MGKVYTAILGGQAKLIDTGLPFPSVYLDYDVLNALAGTPAGRAIRKMISLDKGTLCLTWFQLARILALDGKEFERVVNYLETFRDRISILESHSKELIERENRCRDLSELPLLPLDRTAPKLVEKYRDEETEVSIRLLLTAIGRERGLFAAIKRRLEENERLCHAFFRDERKKYRTDPETREKIDGLHEEAREMFEYNPALPAYYVQRMLIQASIQARERFQHSDTYKYESAIVSLSYCTFVILNHKWAARAKRLRLPQPCAEVFNSQEIPSFIKNLKFSCRWGA